MTADVTWEERMSFVAGVAQLYEIRFGYPPDGKDLKKAEEYVQWRYGGQGFVDAVKMIQEMRKGSATGFVEPNSGSGDLLGTVTAAKP